MIQGRKRGARVRLRQVRATRSCSPARTDQSCPLTSAIAELERNYSSRGAAIAIWRRALSDHVASPELIAARNSFLSTWVTRTYSSCYRYHLLAICRKFLVSDERLPESQSSLFLSLSLFFRARFALTQTRYPLHLYSSKETSTKPNQSTERAIKTEQPALFCNSEHRRRGPILILLKIEKPARVVCHHSCKNIKQNINS